MGYDFFKGSIRKKLVVLVLLATLPAFLMYFYSDFERRQEKIDDAQKDLTRLLAGFGQIQQRITASTETLLKTIAAMPEVRDLKEKEVQVILSTLLKANPIYTNVILVDLKGNVITAGKGVAKAKKYNFSDRKQFIDAIRTRDFSAGKFVIGKHTKKSIFPFGIPVLGKDSNPVGVVIIGVSLEHYGKLFEDIEFYEKSFFGIADSHGVILFRQPMPEGLSIGTEIKPDIFEAATEQSPGTIETTYSNGVKRIVAYIPLRIDPESPPYLYMFMGLDAKKVMQKADLLFFRSMLTTIGSLFLALAIAWYVGGRKIARSLEKIARGARKLGEGEDNLMSGIDFSDGELGDLAKSFDTMSELLNKREKERNDALRTFRESEEQHRILLEENPGGICLVDFETYIIEFANPAFLDLLEISPEQVGSLSVFQLPKDLNVDLSNTDFRDLFELGGLSLPEVVCTTKSEKIVVVDITSAKIKILGRWFLAGFFTDITERKIVENEMLQAKESAENANAAKDDFLANISHEVRTPLNGALGMLQLLAGTELDITQKGYVQTGLKSSHSLMCVLDDLLDFSKIEAGKFELITEPFEVNVLVHQCIDLLKVSAEEKGLELVSHVHEGTKEVYLGDVGRLRQILFNLIGNAIKFTESGAIKVEVYALSHTEQGKERLFFTVNDNGIGIPDDKQVTIFDSFTQVDGSRSRKHQGVGLGLSIVRRLVSLMGGTLVLDSELHVGTTVLFSIVAGVGKVEMLNCNDSETCFLDLRRLNVLLVEDEAVNRLTACRLLEQMGHTVTCVNDGQQCLDAILLDTYDVVLMDIQMPVMSGFEATKRIRNSSDFSSVSSVPIVALSAHVSQSDKDAAFEAGMNHFVTKPFDRDELDRIMHKVIGS